MRKRAYWLFKSEPDCWSFSQQKQKGELGEEWSGVRNYEARNNMQKMQLGDKGFFYHSNKQRSIVGIVEVSKTAAKDSTSDSDIWQCVHVKAICDVKKPVTLSDIKAHPLLQDMALIKRSRLSVAPVSEQEWQIICEMAGLQAL